MPRDQRLYMTFPIEFPEHPKVKILSDAAFRVFVEINAYSRRLGLDGKVPVAVAHATWRPRAIGELLRNHPERPSLRVDGEDYIIHNYADHQLTNADIEDLREKRAEAGKKGGNATANARANAVANAKQPGSKVQAESESESGLLTDVTKDYESGHLGDAPEIDSDPISPFTIQARALGINDLGAARSLLAKTVGEAVSMRGALDLCKAILSKSARPVARADAYVAKVCRESAPEVQQAYFDLDIEGVA